MCMQTNHYEKRNEREQQQNTTIDGINWFISDLEVEVYFFSFSNFFVDYVFALGNRQRKNPYSDLRQRLAASAERKSSW
jgi:hypothetical protein